MSESVATIEGHGRVAFTSPSGQRVSIQSGTTTLTGSTSITFTTPFFNIPNIVGVISDGSDGTVIISNKSKSGFTVTVRVFATTSVAGNTHTHSVPALSVPALSVPSLSISSPSTVAHVPAGNGAVSPATVIDGTGTAQKFAATISGGVANSQFTALSSSAPADVVPTTTSSWSDNTVVLSSGFPSGTGTGSTGTGSTGTGTSGTPSANKTVTNGWQNSGGSVTIDWFAIGT